MSSIILKHGSGIEGVQRHSGTPERDTMSYLERKFRYCSKHIDYLNNGFSQVIKHHHHVCVVKAEGVEGANEVNIINHASDC